MGGFSWNWCRRHYWKSVERYKFYGNLTKIPGPLYECLGFMWLTETCVGQQQHKKYSFLPFSVNSFSTVGLYCWPW
jgi:hypothetical protein